MWKEIAIEMPFLMVNDLNMFLLLDKKNILCQFLYCPILFLPFSDLLFLTDWYYNFSIPCNANTAEGIRGK